MKLTIKRTAAAIGIIGLAVALTGCGGSKRIEQYQDAPIQARNETPAVVGTMPDGFSNWAAKCDGPNRVYVIFHYSNNKESGGDSYGSIAVVPGDPRCAGAK